MSCGGQGGRQVSAAAQFSPVSSLATDQPHWPHGTPGNDQPLLHSEPTCTPGPSALGWLWSRMERESQVDEGGPKSWGMQEDTGHVARVFTWGAQTPHLAEKRGSWEAQ